MELISHTLWPLGVGDVHVMGAILWPTFQILQWPCINYFLCLLNPLVDGRIHTWNHRESWTIPVIFLGEVEPPNLCQPCITRSDNTFYRGWKHPYLPCKYYFQFLVLLFLQAGRMPLLSFHVKGIGVTTHSWISRASIPLLSGSVASVLTISLCHYLCSTYCLFYNISTIVYFAMISIFYLNECLNASCLWEYDQRPRLSLS